MQDVLMVNSGARHERPEDHIFRDHSNVDHERRLSRAVNIDPAATGASNGWSEVNMFDRSKV